MIDALAHGDKYRENSRLQKQAQAGNAKQNLRLNDVNTETKKWGGAPWTEDRDKLTRQTAILPIQSTRRQ